MKKFKDNIKFSFTPDFQLEILRFVLRDKEGGLVLKRIKANYLVLIEHALIFEGISKYFKNQGKMPSENVLKEVLKELLVFDDTSKQPSRIKCATLSANGIKKFLEEDHS